MRHPCDGLVAELESGRSAIAVIGLGYVGLPLACCLARRFRVLGYDSDPAKRARLRAGTDISGYGVDEAELARLEMQEDASGLAAARLFIIAVPTPVDTARQPDLRHLLAATRLVAEQLRPGCCVVYESTVYPGCTEEDCLPELERISGLGVDRDLALGYSPERINP
ncbi:MAG: hypothetical protein ACOCXJ_05200, partial [Planctomycetota bacterium]